MLSMASYRESWERKKRWYLQHGYWDQVITSEDKPDGGIDTPIIEQLARNHIIQEP
jgi:hypothetical protein